MQILRAFQYSCRRSRPYGVAQHLGLSGLQQGLLSVVGQNGGEQLLRGEVVEVTLEAVASDFGQDTHLRIGLVCADVIPLEPRVAAQFHRAPFRPHVVIHREHHSQSGNDFRFAVGCQPPLHHLIQGVSGRFSDLTGHPCHKVAHHLISLSCGDDGKVGVVLEYPFAGIPHLKTFSAFGADATAHALGKVVGALPLVTALGAGDAAALCPMGIMGEAVLKGVCLLLSGGAGQSV